MQKQLFVWYPGNDITRITSCATPIEAAGKALPLKFPHHQISGSWPAYGSLSKSTSSTYLLRRTQSHSAEPPTKSLETVGVSNGSKAPKAAVRPFIPLFSVSLSDTPLRASHACTIAGHRTDGIYLDRNIHPCNCIPGLQRRELPMALGFSEPAHPRMLTII